MNISFAWWNTSLSPTYRKRDQANPDERQIAASMLRAFTHEMAVDLIALCEVSPGDLEQLQRDCAHDDYAIHSATGTIGRSAFDMGVFYRTEKLKLVAATYIASSAGGARLTKIGQHLQFAMPSESEPLHVFISHWSSRLNVQQFQPERHVLGVRLRDAVNAILEKESRAKIVLLGDYNDEPFDAPIAEHLMATRDRRLATRRKHLLYNPFWRHMTSCDEGVEPTVSDRGSYFHKAGSVTQWRTFDQMMFSSAFLGSSNWHLNEVNTRVLDVPSFADLVASGDMRFDHLPIIGQIEKKGVLNG